MHITPLLSWDFVHVGALAWSDAGETISCDVPKGVELRVEPAGKTETIFDADCPWERDRLGWAQVMADDGRYRLWYGVTCVEPRKRESLCYAESEDGWVRFELVDRLVWPPQTTPGIDGLSFEDMTPLTGDETHAVVAWKGASDLSKLNGQSVAVRVRMHKATLFSITMYGVDEPLLRNDPRFPV